MVVTPARAARYARKLREEEARWAAKAGPVTVRHDPSIMRKPR